MKARVLTHHTGAPASEAASGLSPVATRVRPKGERISSTPATETTARMITEKGSSSTTGTSSMPPRPIWRKVSTGLPVAAPPVRKSTSPPRASIVPRVTMKLGTLSTVVPRPLTRPTAAPTSSIRPNAGSTRASSSPM